MKIFYISEEEKQRILNLHESRTKKQYLVEEYTYLRPKVVAIDYVNNRDKETKSIKDKCASIKLPTDTTANVTNIYNAATKSFANDPKFFSTFIVAHAAKSLKTEIDKIQSLGEFCLVLQKYRETFKREMDEDINFAFYRNDSWLYNFGDRIKKLSSSQKIENKFTNFPCVVEKNPNGKYKNGEKGLQYVLPAGLDFYSFYDTGAFFITKPNGTELPEGSDKYYKYSCEKDGRVMYEDTSDLVDFNGNPINSSNTGVETGTGNGAQSEVNTQTNTGVQSGTNTQTNTGTQSGSNTSVGANNFGIVIPGVITPQKLAELRNSIGLKGTSETLNQDDINKLYDIVSKL